MENINFHLKQKPLTLDFTSRSGSARCQAAPPRRVSTRESECFVSGLEAKLGFEVVMGFIFSKGSINEEAFILIRQ